ncbi:MAG: 16S rRNA (guanine(527)-N(7))-methyltransferase RsmG [Chloroflexi bacterium]|nr:16S rRNA (guanine(527)-N(7))-methyltransferase RsmG [Chloroflexota bacterium]
MDLFTLLAEGAAKLRLSLSPAQLAQFTRYREELLAWNHRVNLTAITDPQEVERLHFLDSLTVSLAMPSPVPPGYRVCDVGAGAGFPGLPLKIALPQIGLALVEATAKRTAFLVRLVSALALDGVAIHTGRAEELAHQPELRETFDLVTARAVAELPVLLELTLPFCAIGGRAVLLKKGDISQEVASAAKALEELGGRLANLTPVPEDLLPGGRTLVVVEKTSPSPVKYPRRPGMPAKRPL